MAELDDLEERLEDARQNGNYVPEPGSRHPEFHPRYNRRDDDADRGGGGAGGMAYGGGGYGGGPGQATAA